MEGGGWEWTRVISQVKAQDEVMITVRRQRSGGVGQAKERWERADDKVSCRQSERQMAPHRNLLTLCEMAISVVEVAKVKRGHAT